MRRVFFILLGLFFTFSAYAEPTLNVCVLDSCATGYYKNTSVCSSCVAPGTSSDHNAGGITSCYIPSGTTGSDSTGTYVYVSNCNYSN